MHLPERTGKLFHYRAKLDYSVLTGVRLYYKQQERLDEIHNFMVDELSKTARITTLVIGDFFFSKEYL